MFDNPIADYLRLPDVDADSSVMDLIPNDGRKLSDYQTRLVARYLKFLALYMPLSDDLTKLCEYFGIDRNTCIRLSEMN